jgi:hypothetical protein
LIINKEGVIKNSYNVRKEATQNHGHRWEDNIKMDLEVDWEAVDCINLFRLWDQ